MAVPGAEGRGGVGGEAVQAALGVSCAGEVGRFRVGGEQAGAGVRGVVVDLAQLPAFPGGQVAVLARRVAGGVVAPVDVADAQGPVVAGQQEELSLPGRGDLEVAVALRERGEFIVAGGGQRLAGPEAQEFQLSGPEVGRSGLPAALVHDRGAPESARGAAAVRPVRVVEVGQAQHVAEFVAEDAQAPLRADRERVDPLAADVQVASVCGEPPVLGPDGILPAAVVLAPAGGDQEDVLERTVGVIVVAGEVDVALTLRAGLAHGLRQVDVLAVRVVGAVIGRLPGQGGHGGEGEFEGGLPVELAVEVALRLADGGFQLCGRGGEGPVGELHGQDDHPEHGQQQGQTQHNNHTKVAIFFHKRKAGGMAPPLRTGS